MARLLLRCVPYPFHMARATLWNANTHYHRILIDALPSAAQRVLDVGCGDGILAAELVEAGVSRVVALDSDAAVLARAQARHHGLPIEWMHGDIFNLPAPVEVLFDAVFSVATLHHFDAAAGLTRFAELTRPGGVVGVIGLAANDWWDLPYAAFGRIVQRTVGMIRGYWEHSAPTMWPPPATYREMKRIAPSVLPSVRYRRLLYNRYSLIWTRPGSAKGVHLLRDP